MSEEDTSGKYGSPRYALTDAQRKFLKTGDSGGYRESRLEKGIREKVDILGHRIDHLLADVDLLHSNGFLDDETWGDAWTEFIGFGESPVAPSTFRTMEEFAGAEKEPGIDDLVDACTYGPKPGSAQPTSSPAAFARDLGQFAHQTMLHPVGVDPDEVLQDMIWGFVQGAYLDHRPAGGDSLLDEKYVELQEERLEDVISSLRDHAQREVEAVEQRHQEHMERQERTEEWDVVRSEMVSQIRETLYEEGLPIQPQYTSEKLNEELDDFSEETSKHGLDPHLLLGYAIDDVVDSNHPPMSAGQWIEFTTEYAPIEEFEPDEVVTRERILSIVEERRLLEKAKLSEFRDRDADRLQEKGARGVDAIDVFEEICYGQQPSSKAIARELGSETSYQSQVTQLCTDLSGREWTDRPVVTGDKGGWKTTDYGAYLGRSLFGNEFSTPTDADEQDLSTRAAGEIGVEINWEYSE